MSDKKQPQQPEEAKSEWFNPDLMFYITTTSLNIFNGRLGCHRPTQSGAYLWSEGNPKKHKMNYESLEKMVKSGCQVYGH